VDVTYIRASGVVGLTITMLGLMAPKDTKMMLLLTVGALFWALNNFLLGAHTACVLSLVSSARTFTSMQLKGSDSRFRLPACLTFSGVTITAGALTWGGLISLFPMAGSLCSTAGNFFLNGMRLRLALGTSNLLWLASAIHFRAWEQIVSQVATLLATGFGVWRAYQVAASRKGELQPHSIL
jgi:hypothetical protein